MNTLLTVFFKEVRENLRDRRTILSALVYAPLFMPIFFVMVMNVVLTREFSRAEAPLKVPVIGAEHAPNLIKTLTQMGLQAGDPVDDPIGAIRDETADVVLVVPPQYAAAWDEGRPAQVELYYDSSRRDSHTPLARINKMLEQYSRQQGALRVAARGMSPTLILPVMVDQRDQSTPQSRAFLIFMMLPYLFVLTIIIGGMYLAIDLTAGERERQSLEPLFANPVPRWQVLAGKVLAIAFFAFASLVISIVAFAVASSFLPSEKLGMTFDLGFRFGLYTLVLMLPLVLVLSILQTLVAAFAKTYREAQTYLSMLMMVPALPIIFMTLVPMKTQAWMFSVPLLAQQVGLSELLRGSQLSAGNIGLSLVTGGLVALVLALVTAFVYRSERLAISA